MAAHAGWLPTRALQASIPESSSYSAVLKKNVSPIGRHLNKTDARACAAIASAARAHAHAAPHRYPSGSGTLMHMVRARAREVSDDPKREAAH